MKKKQTEEGQSTMALIKCSECGRDVSDRAGVCPHCGAPLLRQAPVRVVRAARWYEAIGALLVIGGFIAAVAGASVSGWLVLIVGFVIFIVGRFK
jgi:DNA-directed RNA polymerase subunit RPC12/RpoP